MRSPFYSSGLIGGIFGFILAGTSVVGSSGSTQLPFTEASMTLSPSVTSHQQPSPPVPLNSIETQAHPESDVATQPPISTESHSIVNSTFVVSSGFDCWYLPSTCQLLLFVQR